VVDVGECNWCRSFFFLKSSSTAPEDSLMRGEWPARWEPQEEGMMSIAASFSSVKKPRFMSIRRKADNTTEGDVD
jgi:hypothetical protein